MGFLARMIQEDFSGRQAREVEVPEWNKTLYVFPLTIGQLSAIEEEPNQYTRAARIIVTRGKNADGSPMFDEDDYKKMCSHGSVGRTSLEVIGRVAGELMADESSAVTVEQVDEEMEQREKN